jgi:hypothetical protein
MPTRWRNCAGGLTSSACRPKYSLIERTVERELIPMAKALNIGVTAWSPLAGGVLTGKYHGSESSEPGRMSTDMMKGFMPERERTDRIVAAVRRVSPETGRGHGAGGARMASLPARAGNSHRRRPQALSVAGQSRELRPDRSERWSAGSDSDVNRAAGGSG